MKIMSGARRCAAVGLVMAALLPLWAVGAELPNLVGLVKQLRPVVVNVSIKQNLKPGNGMRQLDEAPFQGQTPGLEEFFRRFFDGGQGGDDNLQSRSLGSGVIIDAAGYILTNYHVIEGADEISDHLGDDAELPAEVVGRDAKTDLALLRINSKTPLPVARLGDSEQAEVGSWVIAIGNPFGLDATVTVGIISAKGRVIGSGPYDDFIQTDAAINPGNSGGPLFNLDGEVIGINSAIFSRTGGSMGIGFAIPVNMAKSIVEQLKASGHVTRGWLGVRIQSITKQLADAMGLGKTSGALVASVDAAGPAASAGVRPGDVIVKFNGIAVDKMTDLPAIVAATPVGKQVEVELLRDNQFTTVEVEVGELKDEETTVATSAPGRADGGELGITARNLTPELRQQLELGDEASGVVVAGLDDKNPAYEAGLRPGDLVTSINRTEIKNLNDFKRTLGTVKVGETVLMLVIRQGDPIFMAFKRK